MFADGLDGTMRVLAVGETFAGVMNNEALSLGLGALGDGLTAVDLFNTTYWFKNGTRKSWQDTASNVCYSARQIVIGANCVGIDLNTVAGTIGNIPILGLFTNGMRVVGYGFSLWHNVNVIRKSNTEMRVAEFSRNYWKHTYDNVKFLKEHHGPILDAYIEESVISREDKQELHALTPRSERAQTPDRLKQLAGRVKYYSDQYDKALCEKRKSRTSVVNAINQIALGIFSIIGLIFAPILVGSLAMGFALYMSVYAIGLFVYHQSLSKHS